MIEKQKPPVMKHETPKMRDQGLMKMLGKEIEIKIRFNRLNENTGGAIKKRMMEEMDSQDDSQEDD